MRTEEIIRNLNYTIKKHSNDRVFTGQTNISAMCKDILPRMEQLKAYEDAEEQGLLHRTQVAIGQTVYTNFAMSGWYLRDKDRPYKAKVVFIGLNDSEEMGGGFFNIAYEKLGCMMQFRFSDIGKSVFLTKEEAERELERIKNNG